MPPARSSLRRLVASTAGRLGVSAAMLAAAAAVVVTGGGGGLFGALGALVSGAGARTAVEGPATTAAAGGPAGAIVAAPALAVRPGSPGAGRRGGRGRRPGGPGRGPRGGSGPGGGPPGGGTAPGGGSPGGGGGGPPGGGGGGGGPGSGSPAGDAIDTAARVVEEVGTQAPEPARPVADQLNRVVGGVRDTCRGVALCP